MCCRLMEESQTSYKEMEEERLCLIQNANVPFTDKQEAIWSSNTFVVTEPRFCSVATFLKFILKDIDECN